MNPASLALSYFLTGAILGLVGIWYCWASLQDPKRRKYFDDAYETERFVTSIAANPTTLVLFLTICGFVWLPLAVVSFFSEGRR